MLDVISSLPLKSVGSDWEGGVLVHVHMIIFLIECVCVGGCPQNAVTLLPMTVSS